MRSALTAFLAAAVNRLRSSSAPGDWLGLGYFDRHTYRARATVCTRVSPFPRSDVTTLVERDPAVRTRLVIAIEREFEFVHHALRYGNPPSRAERVAAFLLGLVSMNRSPGGDPAHIVDSIPSSLMAGTLGRWFDALADVLVDFELRGPVEPRSPDGLRLKNVAELEALAAGMGASP